MKTGAGTREYGFDNIRFLLILCVVFGHLLEIRNPFGGDFLYRGIYAFHMPVFLFIAGWFARYDRKKIVFGLLMPYLIFQTAYILFDRWLYGSDRAMQFTTPYWLLWFLPALLFYYLLLPLYDVAGWKKQLAVWVAVLAVSVAVGYDKTIGYGMTLSRFFVFQPWFLLGFYLRQADGLARRLEALSRTGKLLAGGGVILVLIGAMAALYISPVTGKMLYGSYPYASLGYHAGIRLFGAGLALIWILFFAFVLKPVMNIRIPLVTAIGQNTLPVFLLHGFAVKYIGARCPDLLNSPAGLLLITCGIVVLLGNPVTAGLFGYLMPGYWASRLTGRKK